MSASLIPAAIDAILVAFRAASGLADPVQVYDGPTITGDTPADCVYVGYDGDPDGEMLAVTSRQAWDGLGAHKKRETFDVLCAAVSWTGEVSVKTARDAVFALYSAAEGALRASPALTLAPPATFAVTEGQFFQAQTPQGLQARLLFTVSVSARI